MAIHSASGGFTRPAQTVTQVGVIPAPLKGVDARVSVVNAPPEVCSYAYNIMPAEGGMRVRRGFEEFAVITPISSSEGVRAIVPYTTNGEIGSDDALFAVTEEGIWNVTAGGSITTRDVAFPSTGVAAGWGVFTSTSTDAGRQILFYADTAAGNGLWQYDDSDMPGTWVWSKSKFTKPGSNDPEDANNVTFVTIHKQRMWVFEVDSDTAYYADTVGGIAGALEAFYFGGKFKHGGHLSGLYNWTVDGGEGVDDYLVAVSSSGDVIVYAGSDPSGTDWSTVGTYYIGDVPEGVRVGTEIGGDLHLLSRFGVVAMSDLIKGVDVKDSSSVTTTYPIAPFIREAMRESANKYGWGIDYQVGTGSLVINSPTRNNGIDVQYVMTVTTGGWGFWRGVPMLNNESYKGITYFGTRDNRVMSMDSDTDEGEAIEYSMLTSSQNMGSPAVFKRATHVRPDWRAVESPVYSAKILYDYDITEIALPKGTPVATGALWDFSIWDIAIWGAGAVESHHNATGAWGVGRTFAVALTGKASKPTTLLSFDIMWNTGGVL